MGQYRDDASWSEQFIPEMRCLIGPHLLTPSSLEQDRHEASDLVVLRGRDMTIACRIRRPGYASRYPHQFTLRSHRENNMKTELAKIIEGWGDWLFYGHARTTEAVDGIEPWWLIDLSNFRAHLIRDGYRCTRQLRHDKQSNNDGTWFRWFDINSFSADPPLLVASSQSAPLMSPSTS